MSLATIFSPTTFYMSALRKSRAKISYFDWGFGSRIQIFVLFVSSIVPSLFSAALWGHDNLDLINKVASLLEKTI